MMGMYADMLERWPVPHDEQIVETRYGDAFVVSFGDTAAPPLVLLHGAASNSAMWSGDAAAYAAEFRVHAVDLPGDAGRSTPSRPPYGGPTYVEWLGDVFDALRIERARVVGLSLGGWIAMRFAAAQASRVDRLVVISPGGIVPVRKTFIERMFGWMMPRGAGRTSLSKMNMAGLGTAMIKGIMKKKNVLSLPELIAAAQHAGVRLVACTMTMDLMGIKREELIDGVEEGGVATYLDRAGSANVNLFIG